MRSQPLAELHLHIEGTLEPEMVFALAARNGVELPFADVDALRTAYEFTDLQSFLDLYYACTAVLREPADFAELCQAYLRRAVADGVRHAEIFFDPQAHVVRSVPLDVVLDGLLAGVRAGEDEHGITVGLIPCFLRDRGPDDAMRTLEALAPHAPSLVAVGLDSAEVGYPPSQFVEVFDAVAQLGLHRVAHAGEEGPPEYVWQALDVLGAERIDHGIRSLEDPALVERLRRDQIPLTVCPLSNVRLRCVDTIETHPIARMLDAGLVVTVNSDDPAYFGGYLGANYEAVAASGLGPDALATVAANSMRARFGTSTYEAGVPGPLRDRLVAAILRGEKTAGSSLLAEFKADGEPLPRAGERQVLLDSARQPVGAVVLTEVSVIRLGDADDRLAHDEGEGFASVAEWRTAHEMFWRRHALPSLPAAFALDDDSEVVVERFRLVTP